MENSVGRNSDGVQVKIAVGMLWILSLVIVGFIGYSVGQGNLKNPAPQTSSNVLSAGITEPPRQTAQVSPTVATAPLNTNTAPCTKSGYGQKWEYLTSYKIKEGDSLPSIAEEQLGSADRVNEILKLNGVGPLVVGATLYLPPQSITKSSGNIKQVSGKLISKNASMWHLSFNEDEKGLGLLIPTYWFEKIAARDSYRVGDCVTILLDDGNTVFAVSRQ